MAAIIVLFSLQLLIVVGLFVIVLRLTTALSELEWINHKFLMLLANQKKED